MADDLGGGLFLITQDDDLTLDDGPVGQVLNDGVPDLVVQINEALSTVVEDVSEVRIVDTEQDVVILDELYPQQHLDLVDIVAGPAGPQGEQGPQGDQGPIGPSGGTTYTHVQSSSSALWTVNHLLGLHPSVTVVDSGGTQVIGAVQYVDADSLTIEFSAPFAGRAYLN